MNPLRLLLGHAKKTLFTLAMLTLTGLAVATPLYHVTDLGTLGGQYSFAYAINENGVVTGDSYLASGQVSAFRYGTAMTSMGQLGGGFSYSGGINNSGTVVGYSVTSSSEFHAFLNAGTQIRDLGIPTRLNVATGINDNNTIIGYVEGHPNTGGRRAFIYQGGQLSIIQTLGGSQSEALAINNSGHVVGWSSSNSVFQRAFLYDGAIIDLGTLGGSTSIALAINEPGQVVGTAFLANDALQHAFLYRAGQMHDLGSLAPSRRSVAYGINDSAQVVGESETSDGTWAAFYFQDGQMLELNDLLEPGSGWYIQTARDINNAGQIAAYAYHPVHGPHAVRLDPITPVPEAATPALLLLGLLCIAGFRHRQ